MNPKPLVPLAVAINLLAGCLGSTPEFEAVIVAPSDASRAALQSTLAGLLGGYEVTLADDALTRSSLLVLEPSAQNRSSIRPLGGRVVTEPVRFRLVKTGGECVLVDLRDGSRHLLADTTCEPESR